MPPPPPDQRRRLLFVVTEDWYFVSHRLGLAVAARAAGWDVAVATRVDRHADAIRAAGVELIPLQALRRSSFNPLRELCAVLELRRVYARWRPDLVHHVALKPVVYGSIAAALAGIPARVNALAGLGFVFAGERPLARRLRPLVQRALRWALAARGSRVVVQNPDDAALVQRLGVAPSQVRLVRGSGVDLQAFRPAAASMGGPLVVLMSRLLWDKGVGEFVAAAVALRTRGVTARFALVGTPDPENPASIDPAQVAQWQREGAVEVWGFRADAAEVLRQATVVVLPSYREGLPKVLLEAAACGRALVATDVPGCREVVQHEHTGLLVPARDAAALADAIARLLDDEALCTRLGANARALAEREFGTEAVYARTLAIYDEVVG